MQGDLCYTGTSGSLAYSVGSSRAGNLIFKARDDNGWANILFAPNEVYGCSFTILAYWEGAPDATVGGENTAPQQVSSGAYKINYSGYAGVRGNAQWVKVRRRPWSAGAVLKVHFSYNGHASGCAAESAYVSAFDASGGYRFDAHVPCNHGTGPDSHMATKDDPGVAITFDADGNVTKIERI